MTAGSRVFLNSSLAAFLWLGLLYALLGILLAVAGPPGPDYETRIGYFFGFWLGVPAALLMVLFLMPFVWGLRKLQEGYRFKVWLPVALALPATYALFVLFLQLPSLQFLLLPVLLCLMFLFPVRAGVEGFDAVEFFAPALMISASFTFYWALLQRNAARLESTYPAARGCQGLPHDADD